MFVVVAFRSAWFAPQAKQLSIKSIILGVLGSFLLSSTVLLQSAFAQDFTIVSGQTVNSIQNMNTAGNIGIIESGGTITLGGDGVAGFGDAPTITNNGTISVFGNANEAINHSGDNYTVINRGTMISTGTGSEVLQMAGGNDGSIENSGTLMSSGTNSHVINTFAGNNITITNTGTITTDGTGARGITGTGNNFTIINSGLINSDLSHGIRQTGDDINITNTGTITAGADGITTSGANANINNSGTIETSANNGNAVEILGASSSVTNSGTLTVSGTGAVTVDLDDAGADDVTLTNSGVISATGNATQAISGGTGAQTLTLNSGSEITGSINLSDGTNVINNGTGATITGDITTGTGDDTFNNDGTFTGNANLGDGNNIVTNTSANSFIGNLTTGAGNDTFTNTGAFSGNIDLGAGDDTLNLGAGSQITGTIDLGAGTDTVNVTDRSGPSAALSFSNAENINIASGVAGVVVGNSVVTVDPTGQSIQGQIVNTITTSVHRIVIQQAGHTGASIAPQTASLDTSGTLLSEAGEKYAKRSIQGAWFEAFGAALSRTGSDATLAYDHDYGGFAAGYEKKFDNLHIGLVAGYSFGTIATEVRSIKTSVESFLGGAYAKFQGYGMTVTGSLIGGYEDYANQRAVLDSNNGFETARATFNNIFVSPSVTVETSYKLKERYELRPSLSFAYTAAFFDGYTETGTTASNLTVEDRTVQTYNTRAQLEGLYTRGKAVFGLRTGIDFRSMNNEDVNANLSGTSFQFATTDDESVLGAFVGARIRVGNYNGLSVTADAEYRRADGSEEEISGRLRLRYGF
ncbi:MAG: autotransporter domain-containing protein [Alphaproteobacteria bacterium]|nr:autotransporter domain-containing protein [Alphaproteobacteria bacterium]